MNFGEKVRAERTAHHLTQAELAEKIGVTVRTMQRYENGTSYPKSRKIYKQLAVIFGCATNYLLTEEESFVAEAREQHGSKGDRQAKKILEDVKLLFKEGNLSNDDMDELMRAIQDAYWIAKEKNKKYSSK